MSEETKNNPTHRAVLLQQMWYEELEAEAIRQKIPVPQMLERMIRDCIWKQARR